jgi:Ni/Co efflux regulator RcnB
MKNFRAPVYLVLLLVFATLSLSHHAIADNWGSHHSGRDMNQRHENHWDVDNDNRDDDDDKYRKYSREHYKGKPRHYDHRTVYYVPSYHSRYDQVYYRPWYREEAAIPTFRIGATMPHYVRCKEPPRSVVAILPPVERGTRYVQVDRDIYLMSEASRKILDAVVLISAANR